MYILTNVFVLFNKLNILQKLISSVKTVEASFKEPTSKLAYAVTNHGDSTVNFINLTWLTSFVWTFSTELGCNTGHTAGIFLHTAPVTRYTVPVQIPYLRVR
jgi:hypothetical protein